jgi:DNA-binding MarR family transcriptional regulator
MGITKKILLALKHSTTYNVGLLQAKAYRILRKETTIALKGTGISTIDWAFLGLLYESKNIGMRSKDAAAELGTKPPFITERSKVLEKKGLIVVKEHETDARTNVICITEKGRVFLKQTEKKVREHMERTIKGISRSDILSYLAVLNGIVDNSAKEK